MRLPELLPLRHARMRVSPFAFLRGAAAVMAADLATTPATGLRAQSCGDCHLMNFGSFATPEGTPVFDINDFDETLPAPFEWDVKRLATSLILAGRDGGLDAAASRHLAILAVEAYARQLAALAALTPFAAWSTRLDLAAAIAAIRPAQARAAAERRLRTRLAASRVHYNLIDAASPVPRLIDKPPLVFRLPAYDAATREAFAHYEATLPEERAVLLRRYRLVDTTFKVVGVGSVGTFCAIALYADADGAPLLLQLKEAQDSVLAPHAGASAYAHQGERVVVGQRVMQAASDLFLGWTQSESAGRQFYVRQLKDSRLASAGAQIEAHSLPAYAVICGRALGRAHARSSDAATLTGYCGTGPNFPRAIATFAEAYAEQTVADWRAFEAAIEQGRLTTASR